MGNYHSDQPIKPEFEPHLENVDPSEVETVNADIVTDWQDNQTRESSEIAEIAIVDENDIPLTQDWFNLARKLRGQNRELLDTIVTLEQALAASRQQLQDYQERSRHHNVLVSQQTAQLQSTQAENSHLLEQLQTSQTQLQQQQSNLEALQQQLQASQKAFAHLERECALLKEETLQNKNQLLLKERQINELQQRLQRQQRYSLQYKAALDECLSSHGKKIDSTQLTHNTTINNNTPANIVSIQPWSSSIEKNIAPSLTPSQVDADASSESSDAIDQTLEDLFSLNPDLQPTSDNTLSVVQTQQEDPQEAQPKENATTETQGQTTNGLLVSSSVPFSFSIERHRQEDAAREKVDLPSFLRRQ
ncbi:MAG: hypothetical protein QNJ37_15915 [Crocosphaera sp.]|nr:hypothetical protein [Crocosphaera sp.]